MRVLTAEQMRELDRRTIEEIGVPGVVLMENAGRGAVELLCAEYAELFPGPVLILCGKGNNGGDGYVMARHLLNRGWLVDTLLLAEADKIVGDAATNLRALRAQGGPLTSISDVEGLQAELALRQPKLVVDALFGTGLNDTLRGIAVQAVDWMNGFRGPVLAVDIPSGVDGSSGRQLGCAVKADLTVSFAAAKLGHLLSPGRDLCGDLRIVDIGIPPHLADALDENYLWMNAEYAAELIPPRPRSGHKGTFGHLLVIAGSQGKSGAALLASAAGLRSGAGLVTLAAPQSLQPILAAALPEIMTEPLAEQQGGLAAAATVELERLSSGKQALAVGPGLGQGTAISALMRALLELARQPLVIDADALNALVGHLDCLRHCKGVTPVLTPHPGEMARLCGISIAEVEADRVKVARDFALRHQVVLVLKGAPTLVAAPDGSLAINGSGNPLLASGGSGDVLTGLIGGLLAQGMEPFRAAQLGVFLHGAAADRLAEKMGNAGLLAGELAAEIPLIRRHLKGEA